MVQMEPGGATLSGIAGTADVTSASSLARSTAGGNFSMIDIRPSYWTLPFVKWSQCARNSGQYSLAKPFRGIAALAMASSLRLLIRGERFAKLR